MTGDLPGVYSWLSPSKCCEFNQPQPAFSETSVTRQCLCIVNIQTYTQKLLCCHFFPCAYCHLLFWSISTPGAHRHVMMVLMRKQRRGGIAFHLSIPISRYFTLYFKDPLQIDGCFLSFRCWGNSNMSRPGVPDTVEGRRQLPGQFFFDSWQELASIHTVLWRRHMSLMKAAYATCWIHKLFLHRGEFMFCPPNQEAFQSNEGSSWTFHYSNLVKNTHTLQS